MKIISDAKFIYRFVGPGTVVNDRHKVELLRPKKNRFFLDVGNDLREGVIDHHHLVEIDGQVNCESSTRLVTENPYFIIDNLLKATDVEIVVHQSPDLDCFGSAYLVKELITKGRLPDHYDLLTNYVDKLSSGKMRLNPNLLRTPFSVAYSIEELIRETARGRHRPKPQPKRKKTQGIKRLGGTKSKFWFNINEMTMRRGLKLIEYMSERISQFPKDQLDNLLYSPSFFPQDNPFADELSLLTDDFSKYQKDLAQCCEKLRVRLPTLKGDSLQTIDALFWNQAPSCLLHKFWARNDLTSPSSQGYVFTFIPFVPMRKKLTDREIWLNTNRVIISVNPNSNVCLRGLSLRLEEAECCVEREQLGSDAPLWRSRDIVRFNESWCNNEDPWYDGRNSSYTIVDAPRTGSLMGIETIKKITLEYTKPKVTNSYVRLVVPFSFDPDYLEQLQECLGNDGALDFNPGTVGSDRSAGYFLPYITDYLYGRTTNNDSKNRRLLFISNWKDKRNNKNKKKQRYCFRYQIHRKHDKKTVSELIAEINQIKDRMGDPFLDTCKVILFKYGMGYLEVDLLQCLVQEQLFEDILWLNYHVRKKSKEFFYYFLPQSVAAQNLEIRFEEGLIYSAISIGVDTLYKSEIQELVYKLANGMLWEKPFGQCGFVDSVIKRSLLDVDQYATYGFSKSGGGIVLIQNNSPFPEKNTIDITKQLMETFVTTDYDIFMLSLHQRNVLMSFSHKLAERGHLKEKRKIANLRQDLLEFITQSWFSQITHNEVGMELYRIWQNMFENETLYKEVSGQLSTVDDVHKGKFTRDVQKLTAILLPLAVWAQIQGGKFLSFYSPTTFWVAVGIYSGAVCFFYLWIKKNYASPYTCIGFADFQSHYGSAPISIVWKMRERLPGFVMRKTVKV